MTAPLSEAADPGPERGLSWSETAVAWPELAPDWPLGVPVCLRDPPPALLGALVAEPVAAGFPSPADDYVEARIDLNIELIPSPLSTFFMRVAGDAMGGDGILAGDLLVIDRSVNPSPGRVVVAVYEGIFVVRRLAQRQGGLWLLASDGATLPIPLQAEGVGGAELWGVVIHAVHHLAGAPSRRR